MVLPMAILAMNIPTIGAYATHHAQKKIVQPPFHPSPTLNASALNAVGIRLTRYEPIVSTPRFNKNLVGPNVNRNIIKKIYINEFILLSNFIPFCNPV